MWKITDEIKYESDKINNDLKVSPWAVNRDFVYDLIKYTEPVNICELGSFYGCSLFAIAQSIKDNNLNSKIFAIDTWEGDDHAGFYGDEVLESVKNIYNEYFKDIEINLRRKRFEDAKDDFEDEFFDLIHIDGYHSYQATKNDYDNYLPKLSKNGIIIFHDIANTTNYGSAKFWNEISGEFPALSLNFSWGLGILFPKGDKVFQDLLMNNIEDKIQIYIYKALFDLEQIKNKDVNEILLKREDIMKAMDKSISERDKTIESMNNLIDLKDEILIQNDLTISDYKKSIDNMTEMINSKDLLIIKNDELIRNYQKTIKEMEKMIEDKNLLISENELMIRERDKTIKSEENNIQDLNKLIRKMELLIKDKNKTINEITKVIDKKDSIIKNNDLIINNRDKTIEAITTLVNEKDDLIQKMSLLLEAKEKTIDSGVIMIKDKDKLIELMSSMIKDRDEAINSMTLMIDDRDAAITSMTRMIDERDELIKKMEKKH